MTPEEIKAANALIAQVVDGMTLEEIEEYHFSGLSWYDNNARSLMRVEEWLAEREFPMITCRGNKFPGKWVTSAANGDRDNVKVSTVDVSDGYMQSRYNACCVLVERIVEQAGSIQAAREWRP